MGDQGYMDAAAVPIPDGDDGLREQLTEGIRDRLFRGHNDAITSVTIGRDTSYPESLADALLPLIRDHIAAAVQAERERADYWKKRAENAWEREDEQAHHLLARATAMQRARALADVSDWHVYESQDTGDVYPADAVRDRMAEIRAALDGTEAAHGTR